MRWHTDDLAQKASSLDIEWRFNPPHASHYSGSWERCIRTIRKALTGVMGDGCVKEEVLTTCMCEAEALVNSRPLTRLGSGPDDVSALTPNHLLLLSGVEYQADVEYSGAEKLRKRWKLVQDLTSSFWSRWKKEYVSTLQHRRKWSGIQRNYKKGDLVILVEVMTPRGQWPLAIVEDVNISHDGLVRQVTVRAKGNTYVRPVTKVVPLECD